MRTQALWRLLALAAFALGLIAAARVLGLRAWLTPSGVQSSMHTAGLWGVLLYLSLFVLAELIHAPTVVLLVAAVLLYGRLLGGVLAWSSSVFAVSVSFWIVRAIGGQPGAAFLQNLSFVKKLLSQLDEHPLRTIVLLRAVFSTAAWLNYSLALFGVRFRDNLLGTALGVVGPVSLIALSTEFALRHLLPHP